MRHLARLKLSKIAVVLLLCTFAISALGAAPSKTTLEFTFDIPGAIACSYGNLDLSLNLQIFRTFFFDPACGCLVRVQDRTVLTSIATNPLNGKTASGTAVNINTSLFDGQQLPTSIQRGVLFRINVDGRPLQLAAGRTVYNPFTGETIVSTPHTSIPPEDAAALCNALQ